MKRSPQGICDNIAEKMLVQFAESGCPIFRATTPLSRCKLRSKGHGKLSIHFAEQIKRLSQLDKVSKFCMDAGFISVVEIGQYFMTKDGEQFYRAARNPF